MYSNVFYNLRVEFGTAEGRRLKPGRVTAVSKAKTCHATRQWHTTIFQKSCLSRAQVAFHSMNWIRHCSITAFETGLKLMHVCRVSIRQKVNKFTNSRKKACLQLCQFLFSNFRHVPASYRFLGNRVRFFFSRTRILTRTRFRLFEQRSDL